LRLFRRKRQEPDWRPPTRTEEELFRLADAWAIMDDLMNDCGGEPHALNQDYVVEALNNLSAAVNGKPRQIPLEDFFERRTMALARMRAAQGKPRGEAQ
jgi:hypothetical protein